VTAVLPYIGDTKVIEQSEIPPLSVYEMVDFAIALPWLREGHRIARAGWNGKGQWVYHVPANSYAAQTAVARAHFGDKVPYRAYLALVTAQADVVPWTPSVSDVLADDWIIYPK
jgi:hypothetical protein